MISVGIEHGANVVKIAVLEGSRASAKVRGFEVHKTDAKKGEVEDDIISVIDEALKRLKAPRDEVVTSIRALDCMIREIIVPFTEEEKIRKTIKYQAENYFTSTSIDDLIIEYSKFAEFDSKSKVLVAGIKKSLVERRLDMLEEFQVDPKAIDLDMAALYNTYAHIGAFEDKGGVLVVDIEADTLKVGVVEEGRLRLARAIRMRLGAMRLATPGDRAPSGIGNLYESMDESARLPVVILDEGDDESFSLEDSGISEVERESMIHRVFMEIDRTVAAVQLGSEVEHIYLTGPSCALDGIEETFAEHFEITCERLDLLKHFGPLPGKASKKDANLSLEGGTAIGLALKGLGVDNSGMDFRQEEFAYKGAFEHLKKGLACALTLLFVFTLLSAFHMRQVRREKSNTKAAVKAMQRNLYTVLFPALDPDESNQFPLDHLPLTAGEENYMGSLQKQVDSLSKKYGGGGSGDRAKFSALEIMRAFARAKAEVRPNWQLEVMKIRVDTRSAGRSQFDCQAVGQGAAVELAGRFEGNENFTASAINTQLDRKTNKWVFTIVVEIKSEDDRG